MPGGWRSEITVSLTGCRGSGGLTRTNVSCSKRYDATLTYSFPKNLYSPVLWPYTLDFGYTLVCNIARCPQHFYKGLWEIPVVGVMDHMEHRLCAYVDDCFNKPRDKADAYQMLWKNFLRNYRSNRAPLYLNLHSPWLNTEYQLEAMDEFIEKMVSMEDVYLVTMSQALAWQQAPTPLDRMTDFTPWLCPDFRPHKEDSKRCSLTFKHKTAPGQGHGTGIETRHERGRHRSKAQTFFTSSKISHTDDSSDRGNPQETEVQTDARGVDGKAREQERSHIHHHHDHRTHKPWFLRGNASVPAKRVDIILILQALVLLCHLIH
ncbi:chitin deacetylase [Plakobranchus ocellatus]|uniref:Chitin deacetylase n=1 Tax=Plakobranchus ocellatus TaxID=259542 RepID=A0AAV3YK67_9GAST|nr:chitin deacetylase [Plakobranchus ocellatus]